MTDVRIQITCHAALEEALEIQPWDEETQIHALIEFIQEHELEDEFQEWIVNRAREERALHMRDAAHELVPPMRPELAAALVREWRPTPDLPLRGVKPEPRAPNCPKCKAPMRACSDGNPDDHCDNEQCLHVEPWGPKRLAAMEKAGWVYEGANDPEYVELPAAVEPADCGCCYGEHEGNCCPGWSHFESDTYGFEIESCDECVRAGRFPELFETDAQGEKWIPSTRLLALHAKTCDCTMGVAKCAPGTKGVAPEHCYATKTEMNADHARREGIAMRLKEQGRL